MSDTNLSQRLHELIVFVTDEYRRYKQLETITNIQADSWKSWFHGRQRPTSEMIEAAAQEWPEFAFWLVTGITDSEHGHIGIATAYESGINEDYPEQKTARIFFKKKIQMLKILRDEKREKIDLIEQTKIGMSRENRRFEYENIQKHLTKGLISIAAGLASMTRDSEFAQKLEEDVNQFKNNKYKKKKE